MANQNPFQKEEKKYREYKSPTETAFGKLHVTAHSVITAEATDEQFEDYLVRSMKRLILNAVDRELQGMQ